MKRTPGKRERVVIACSVFEVPKIIKPIKEYEATKVHIIHYTDKKNKDGKIYQEFYEEVVSQIKEYSKIKEQLGKSVKIVEHKDHRTSDFSKMLMTVHSIIEDEKSLNKDSDIYVNISSGTAEYISAATVATMMAASVMDGIKLFTVGTEPGGYQTYGEENLKRLYYENGKPVGLTRDAREPREVPMFKVNAPDKTLVKALNIFAAFGGPVTANTVINALMDSGLMADDDKDPKVNKKDKTQKIVMKYRRNFLDKWEAEGWVVQPEGSNKYRLTEEGQMIIDTFYVGGSEEDHAGIQK